MFAIWLLFAGSAGASVTLPLDGYCRLGRFFPIRVDGADADRPILFSAEGCLPSQMDAQATGRVVVPMLATGIPRELDWAGGKIPLRVPGENERLIAGTTEQISEASAIFPGKRLLPVRLDPVDLLSGPPLAWETLDAILLDGSLMRRISDQQRSTLLAGGVMLISIGETAPDNRWPWRHVGSLWVLSCPITGPSGDVVNENVYAPTFAWTPGASAAVRGQVMGAGTLLVLITIALMLRPNRLTFSAAIGLSILATAGTIAWRHSLGSVDRAGGDILVVSSGLVQRDAFVYERAKENSTQTIPWSGWTHPLFASDDAATQAAMQLNLSSTGELAFTYHAHAAHTTAFLRRAVKMGPDPITSVLPAGSPMEELARSEYLESGWRIVGETPASDGRWASVVIEPR